MKNGSLLVSAFAGALAIGGCAPMVPAHHAMAPHPRGPAVRCDVGECNIDVTVENCQFTLKPDVVFIRRPSTMIFFTLKTAGWEFVTPTGGFMIKVNESTPTSQPQLINPQLLQPDVLRVHDKNSEIGVFFFELVVRDKQSGNLCKLDPPFVNDP